MVSFLVRNASTSVWESLARLGELVLLLDDGCVLGVEVLELRGDRLATTQCFTREGFIALGERGLGLFGQLVTLGL